MNYIVYENLTGKITKTGRCPVDMVALQAGDGRTVIEGTANDLTEYVVAGAVTPKPAMPVVIDKTEVTADGVDTATMTGLPDPCTLRVQGENHLVEGGEAEVSFDLSGQYVVKIVAFPYLDFEVTINAN